MSEGEEYALWGELFAIDPNSPSGLVRKKKQGTALAGAQAGNRAKAGWVVQIRGKVHQAHRIVWCLLHGPPPPHSFITHVNGDKWDNRRENLRIESQAGQSGVKGVFWSTKSRKWCAMISRKGRRKNLGYFANKQDAARAYQDAAELFDGPARSHESATIILRLPNRALSPNARVHHFARAAATKKYRKEAREATAAQGIDSGPWERATIAATFYHKTARRRDDVNAMAMLKPAYDGIVDAGLLVDDDHEHLTTLPASFALDKQEPRVELVITRQ